MKNPTKAVKKTNPDLDCHVKDHYKGEITIMTASKDIPPNTGPVDESPESSPNHAQSILTLGQDTKVPELKPREINYVSRDYIPEDKEIRTANPFIVFPILAILILAVLLAASFLLNRFSGNIDFNLPEINRLLPKFHKGNDIPDEVKDYKAPSGFQENTIEPVCRDYEWALDIKKGNAEANLIMYNSSGEKRTRRIAL